MPKNVTAVLIESTELASAGGAASWPRTATFQVGRSGAALLHVDVSLVMTCSSSLSTTEDAAVRSILSRNYQNQPWT